MDWSLLALPGLFIWVSILALPWRPWSTRESLDARPDRRDLDLSEVTVLIPARNEAFVIADTLIALARQAPDIKVIIVDDQSTDGTARIATEQNLPNLEIIDGQPLPEGWSGKLWALEQGRRLVKSRLVLLLDADICLKEDTLQTLLEKFHREGLDMLSLMASLRMESFWEKLLMPAFIFFFKLLYPFRISNSSSTAVAAAAGGVILVNQDIMTRIDAFACLRGNLIDDCSLARKIKDQGGKTWIGLTHSAISMRHYVRIGVIWEMVSRTAFTQLRHSWLLLFLCTLLMLAAFVLPLLALAFGAQAILISLFTLVVMIICYLPTLHYYRLHPLWSLTLPVSGFLYLLMTWSSGLQTVFRHGTSWKGRHYPVTSSK
jgi:hopene-associated glycosyltransferase HpnB